MGGFAACAHDISNFQDLDSAAQCDASHDDVRRLVIAADAAALRDGDDEVVLCRDSVGARNPAITRDFVFVPGSFCQPEAKEVLGVEGGGWIPGGAGIHKCDCACGRRDPFALSAEGRDVHAGDGSEVFLGLRLTGAEKILLDGNHGEAGQDAANRDGDHDLHHGEREGKTAVLSAKAFWHF